MPRAPDKKHPMAEAQKAPDDAAPLEFEKISADDAKRSLSDGLGLHRQDAVTQQNQPLAPEVLLDATASWFGELPAYVRPLELGRRYRRIANRICELWKRREACESYFEELLSASPADQKRLPAEIVAELTALRAHYAKLCSESRRVSRGGADSKGNGNGLSSDEALRDTTATWLARLPEPVRPLELARRYPRIANRLCEIWKRPTVCDPYLNDLVMDHRGGRKGFPLKVASELTDLRAYYSRLYPAGHGAWRDGDFMA